jgi:hypothetical protein
MKVYEMGGTCSTYENYRTTGKIIALYILIFKFLDSNREDRRFWIEWLAQLMILKYYSMGESLKEREIPGLTLSDTFVCR